MLKERFKLNLQVLAGVLALFVFLALLPSQAQAMTMRKGTWELDGFFRNNTGFWTENWDYSLNNDPLAVQRNWFRLNLNGKFTRSLKLKAEILAIYETEYSRERHSGVEANEYNQFDFRELRLDWRPKMGHNIRIGKQIVNWGESISARIGDMINPQDKRFDLGFTNLEDSRMPIWMVRGLHQFYAIGTSIDWIVSPYMQPDRYRVSRSHVSTGTVFADGSSVPSPRFAAYPETRNASEDWANGTALVPLYLMTAAGDNYFVMAPGSMVPGLPLFGPPLSYVYANIDGTTADGLLPFVTTADAMGGSVTPGVDFNPFAPAWYSLDGGSSFLPAPPMTFAYPVRAPNLIYDYPSSNLDDTRYGFKTSSTIGGWQTGVYFWHSREMDATMRIAGGLPAGIAGGYDVVVQYPTQNVYGAYGNKNYSFGVLRLDAAYRPNRAFNTTDLAQYPDAIAEKDHLMVQVGLNKDVMWRSINPTATFSFIFEYVGTYILDDLDDIHVPTYFVPYHKDDHVLFASGGTNYNFGMYSYALTLIYNFRNNGLISPSFTYAPDWMNRKWSFKLAYTNIFGDNDFDYPYGLVREKDMVLLTTQFSFP